MKSKHFWWVRIFSAVLFVSLIFSGLGIPPAWAAFTPSTFQAATLVLGQANFTSNGAAASQTGMFLPLSVAVDPVTQKVFVADALNHRVLRFASVISLANGAPAEAVLGQPNFTSNSPATAQNRMNLPSGVFVDSAGRLWVGDHDNNRVLRFDNASALPSGANASAVLGQPNFTSNAAATSQTGMRGPYNLFVDAGGRLWVADDGNGRVLRFDNAASLPNGAPASGVLGRPDFTDNTAGCSATVMSARVTGVEVDSSGRLWVADHLNHRVLRFDNAASLGNGAAASVVLGQVNFVNCVSGTLANRMYGPHDVGIDPSGRLYVAEWNNNRVLIFENAASLSTNSSATYVLGQSNFTTGAVNSGGLSASSLYRPYSTFYDPLQNILWVADAFNNRVLLYGTLDATPPALLSFARQNPPTSPTSADTLVFRATFSEGVQNVDAADFVVNASPATTATITGVTQVSASVYDITVSGGNLARYNGVIGLNLAAGQNITDLVGNPLPAGEPATDETYTLVPASLPATGFAPGVLTILPEQTVSYAASDLVLEIPRLGVRADIFGVPNVGGTWDVSWLGDSAGWLEGTAFPTWAGNSVITAHVYDAYGRPGPFVNLSQLWYGDQIIIRAWGQQYIYEVRSVRQVQPGDTSLLTRHEKYAWLTLITCRGYDEASNSYRYRVVVRAVQVEVR